LSDCKKCQKRWYDSNDVCDQVGISPTTLWGDGSKERPGWVKLGYWPEPDFALGPHKNSKRVWLPETLERGIRELPSKFPRKAPMPANDNSEIES